MPAEFKAKRLHEISGSASIEMAGGDLLQISLNHPLNFIPMHASMTEEGSHHLLARRYKRAGAEPTILKDLGCG
jgi:hypothetical protein